MKTLAAGTADPKPVGLHAQIDALTPTRAFAAILVFIHHFGPGDIFPPAWHIGNIAVCYFFVLSGFVLYYAYHRKDFSYAGYLKRRIARIVPVYLLALFLVICPPDKHFACVLTTARAVKEAFLGAFLLQAYVPSYPLTLNLPGWTISVEMFFYLLFPALLLFQKKHFKYFTIGAIILFLASQAIHLYFYPIRAAISEGTSDTIFFSPFIHLSQFLLGMLCANAFFRLKERIAIGWYLPLIILAICILAIVFRAYHPVRISFQVGLIDPLFALLILSIALNNPAWLRLRPLVFLGDISYGIYILQWPVFTSLAAFNERHWHLSEHQLFYTGFVMLLLFAAIVWYTFERPLQRTINRIDTSRLV